MRVSNMVNIGPKTTELLKSIQITESEELMAQGALSTAVKLKSRFPEEDINPLVFEGAVRGIRWRMIDPLEQDRILREFETMTELGVTA